ncbi:peptidase, S24/S26A/S26B beta-ribbon domain supe rfamily [Formosa agariphila KMM 3901]|uniref:Peptidase, S24/S26A/S26B beta-ribbon domain supe rfamily n=1 Tax=Formosa agariphila (strain DSM 15362 / KCTC 12365 / LMG 23005 / KMM 3901 / M-2Alg 35-1) TaxID=1347342 RepID=T2KPD9_FORAG|nr:translesion error-prone DNA polymerase V autoproteolytic subunit [Formosa agariphila]CDF80311.1 peptidase, S24/S26A/S26B beta-ribbon domain supe rfamily [Formosa agariphila KMM 3901]
MQIRKLYQIKPITFFIPEYTSAIELPFVNGISAGFPSPADDFLDINIDLNKHLIKNPSTTFYGRVNGHSMKNVGIHDGDLLIVDKSLEPKDNKIAVCFIDGEFTVKRIKIEKDCVWLIAENEDYKPICVTADNDFIIWGIVINVIKYF